MEEEERRERVEGRPALKMMWVKVGVGRVVTCLGLSSSRVSGRSSSLSGGKSERAGSVSLRTDEAKRGKRTLAPIPLNMSTKIMPASSPSPVLTSTNATTPWRIKLFPPCLSWEAGSAGMEEVDRDEGREVRRGRLLEEVEEEEAEGREEMLCLRRPRATFELVGGASCGGAKGTVYSS